MPATAEVWLSKWLIERFIQGGCPAASEATRGNYRSRLLRLREAVIGPDLVSGRPVRLSASAASRPYSPAETAALWAWALAQPTTELRHDFQLPAHALGYWLVFDYRQDQLGLQAGTAGAQLIEGTWYCPHSRKPWSPPPAASTARPSTRTPGSAGSPPASRSSSSPKNTPTTKDTSACPAQPPDASSAR